MLDAWVSDDKAMNYTSATAVGIKSEDICPPPPEGTTNPASCQRTFLAYHFASAVADGSYGAVFSTNLYRDTVPPDPAPPSQCPSYLGRWAAAPYLVSELVEGGESTAPSLVLRNQRDAKLDVRLQDGCAVRGSSVDSGFGTRSLPFLGVLSAQFGGGVWSPPDQGHFVMLHNEKIIVAQAHTGDGTLRLDYTAQTHAITYLTHTSPRAAAVADATFTYAGPLYTLANTAWNRGQPWNPRPLGAENRGAAAERRAAAAHAASARQQARQAKHHPAS